MRLQSYRPMIGSLIAPLVTAIDTVLSCHRLSSTISEQQKTVLSAVFHQLYHYANFIMDYVFDVENGRT